MALKNKVSEIKHLLASGIPEELNTLVGNYLNDGWKLLDAKLVNFDTNNRLLAVLYLFVKQPEND